MSAAEIKTKKNQQQKNKKTQSYVAANHNCSIHLGFMPFLACYAHVQYMFPVCLSNLSHSFDFPSANIGLKTL